MRRPLGTSAARIAEAPFVLVDIETEEGVSGRSYCFGYRPLALPAIRRVLAETGSMVRGARIEPQRLDRLLRTRFALLGTQGVVGMALAAFDVACWDALAQAAEQPLSGFLGATARPVRAYNSNGLGLTDPPSLGEEAATLLADGFQAIKIRLGWEDPAADLAAVRSVRAATPAGTVLMADYNQALEPDEAIRRGRMLTDEAIYWIEEPVAHDDLVGAARIAAALSTPVQIGENLGGPHELATAIALAACDRVMPDLMRIGGVTGWLRAAEIARLADIPMSSHLYPEMSVHLLAATTTADWLEYVDWAEPILCEPLPITSGRAEPPARPGSGVAWDEAAVARFAVE